MSMCGRDEDEWERLIKEGLEFLIDRARLGKVTTYTELDATLARRTGARRFDFKRADDRAAMGYLLERIEDRNFPTTKLMISALVHYLGANDAGPGFYALATRLGLLPPKASRREKEEFWINQINGLYAYYSR